MNLNNLVIMPDASTFHGNSIMSYSNNLDQKSNLGENEHAYGNYVNDIKWFQFTSTCRIGKEAYAR